MKARGEGGARIVSRAEEHRLTTVRRARYYTVGGGDVAPAEAWIVLHGFGQLAGGFIRYFQHIASAERLIVAPEALNRFYTESGSSGSHSDARVGAAWMTREDRENEIRDYVDFLDAVHARIAGAGRVTALGFSQGVATAARWVTLGTSRVDRLIVWAGQLPPDLDMDRLRSRLPGGIVSMWKGRPTSMPPGCSGTRGRRAARRRASRWKRSTSTAATGWTRRS